MTLNSVGRLLTVAVIAIALPGLARADRHLCNVTEGGITAVAPPDTTLGKVYAITIDVPNVVKNKKLLKVFLEFEADVTAVENKDFLNNTPMLEVYALTERFDGSLDENKFRRVGAMRRVVKTGESRNIKIDITEAVKEFMADPAKNYGLVVGSLTGSRDGVFDMKSAGGKYATITYYFE